MVTLAKTNKTKRDKDIGLTCIKSKITTNLARNIGKGGIAAILSKRTTIHNVILYLE